MNRDDKRKAERLARNADRNTLKTTRGGVYYLDAEANSRRGYLWTIYTKDAACGRGDYAEEIDVLTVKRPGRGGEAEAKRVAEAALKRDYESGLRVARAVNRIRGFLYV